MTYLTIKIMDSVCSVTTVDTTLKKKGLGSSNYHMMFCLEGIKD